MLELNWNIIWNFVNILVLYWFCKKFLFGPVTAMMEKRSKLVEDSLNEAEEAKAKANDLRAEYENNLKQADDKATQIIKEAKERAEIAKQQSLMETKEEAARLIEGANKTIELQRQKSMDDAQAEIANIAMLAAAKVVAKSVDDQANKDMIKDFLQEAGAAK
ncbi:ATP synthase F0 sector subunit b [Lachnospiraceae bacterium KM106-2]|nr:ATP synthase F0 sector subunit b [Lachnospiraceae bacterium KM106-2]